MEMTIPVMIVVTMKRKEYQMMTVILDMILNRPKRKGPLSKKPRPLQKQIKTIKVNSKSEITACIILRFVFCTRK